jgi:hypothetical protein
MGTENLVKWDRLAARVFKMDGKHIFSGGILPLSQEIAQRVLNMLNNSCDRFNKELLKVADKATVDHIIPPGTMNTGTLQAACPGVSSLWLIDTIMNMHAPPPDMINREGDALIFSETRFPVTDKNADKVVQLLNTSEDFVRSDPDTYFWNWVPPVKTKTHDIKSEDSISFGSSLEDGRPVSGTLELKSSVLLFCANSIERTEKGKQLLEKILHGLAGPALSSLQTPEQLMANKSLERDPGHVQAAEDNIDPAIAAEIVQGFLDNHYRQYLDQPIPMLNNKTPRQCARSKSAKAREQVIEWLKYLENNELCRAADQNQTPYDTRWIWEELKLSEYRD